MPQIDVASAIPSAGFLAEWLRFVDPYESPDSYGVFSLLAAASCGINRRILVNKEGMPEVWTNLYVVLLGPSGARKGEAMKRANKILGAALGNAAPILPRTFSMEACINRMVRDSEDSGRGSGMVVSTEFNRLIGGRDYMKANADFLTDVYDCDDPFTRETIAHGYQEVHKPYLVLQGAIQPSKLELIDESVLTAGLLRRMLIVSENQPKRRPPNPVWNRKLFSALTQVLTKRMAFRVHEDDDEVSMELTHEAMDLKSEWYDGYVRDTWEQSSEKEGHFASCMESHALKLGAIVNVLETGRGDILTAESLRVGQKLVECIVPSMFQAYQGLASTPFGRLRAAVLRGVQAGGGDVDGDALARTIVSSTGIKARDVREAIYSLLEEETLKVPQPGRVALP